MNETPIEERPPDWASLQTPLLLAQLVCTRLTDDVGSQLARLRAGFDVTDQIGPPAATAGNLDPLAQRIELLRACWGTATPRLTARRLALLADGLQGIRGVRRLRLDTSGLPSRAALSVPISRVVLNALLVASESLPRGGVIALADVGQRRVLISIAGTHAAWPRVLQHLMNRPDAAWAALSEPDDLAPPLLCLIAEHAGIRLSFQPAPRMRSTSMPGLLLAVRS